MSSFGQDFLQGFTATSSLRDYTHASKTFRTNAYELKPRFKFLFHVSFTLNVTEIPFLNTSTYVAGRFKWESISVKFKDPIGPSAAQALMEWFRLHAESVTGRMGYAAGYKKDIELEMLDPTGVVVEKWILQGTFLSGLDFGTLDYSQDALADISATLRMDRCILVY